MTRVGKFKVQGGTVYGPAEYLASGNYRETMRKIEAGTHCLIAAAPAGTSVEALVGTILQTDYAAWIGQRSFDTFHGNRLPGLQGVGR